MKKKVIKALVVLLGFGMMLAGKPAMASAVDTDSIETNKRGENDQAEKGSEKSVLELALEAEEFHFSDACYPENNPTERMAHNFYSLPDLRGLSGKYTAFSIDFLAEDIPQNTYWALCAWEMDLSSLCEKYNDVTGGGAYAGLQHNADGQVAIMSFWETSYIDENGNKVIHNAKRIYPSGESYFTGEGDGTNYIGPFPWEANHWYRMMLRCIDSEDKTTIVEQWIMDLESGKWTLISSFDTGIEDSCLTGDLYQFMENFYGSTSNEFRSIRLKNIYVKEKGKDAFTQILGSTLATDNCWDNKKGNFAFGSDGHTFWGITCGYGPDVFDGFDDNDANDIHGPRVGYYTIAEDPDSPDPTDGEFQDVRPDRWYLGAVKFVKQNGIMVGKGNGIFSPEAALTRAEFATILYNMEGKPSVAFTNEILDVKDETAWYAKPVHWAYEQNIAAGYPNGNFGVSDLITREQLAQMLYKYTKLKGYTTDFDETALSRFGDADKVSNWAMEAMKWATSNGVMNGSAHEVPLLNPKANATRAECAAMIKSFVEKMQ